MRGYDLYLEAEYDRMFDADNRNTEDAKESAWYLYALSKGWHFSEGFSWEEYH